MHVAYGVCTAHSERSQQSDRIVLYADVVHWERVKELVCTAYLIYKRTIDNTERADKIRFKQALTKSNKQEP